MQLGFTMTEKMEFSEGQLTNGSLADYKIPSLLDIPASFINEYVDNAQGSGPFGAKGAGETTNIALSPAIGNAVSDAIGAEVMETPLTPETVFRAMHPEGTR